MSSVEGHIRWILGRFNRKAINVHGHYAFTRTALIPGGTRPFGDPDQDDPDEP